jgi:hypothetical protein
MTAISPSKDVGGIPRIYGTVVAGGTVEVVVVVRSAGSLGLPSQRTPSGR